MKKQKISNLKLNKKKVSNLDQDQIQGGILLTIICTVSINYPSKFCTIKNNSREVSWCVC